MKKLICGLGMIGILYVSPSYAQTCSAQPDCATLGYTQVASDCKDKMVKCPFDTSKVVCVEAGANCTDLGFLYTCTGTGYAGGVGTACDNKYSACNCSSVYTWNGSGCSCKSTYAYTCTGTYQTGGAGTTCDGKYTACNCSAMYGWNGSICRQLVVGDILFSDKTVSPNLISGKTAIGVVFDATNRYAVALTQTSSTIRWNTTYTDISGLTNCTSSSTVTTTCGINGKSNTQTIIAQGASNYPAANYCNSYSTVGTNAGDWWLPSAKELWTIYSNQTAINAGLTKAGGSTLTENWYWSSTEYSYSDAWALTMGGGGMFYYGKSASSVVRAVTSF